MRFSKWHALGNAYLLVERAELEQPLTGDQARARAVAPRHRADRTGETVTPVTASRGSAQRTAAVLDGDYGRINVIHTDLTGG